MSLIRVPYPVEPDRRLELFQRLVGLVTKYGTLDGTPDAGTFHGSTPIGRFAGSYDSPAGGDELTIDLEKKPMLIGTQRIETELRKHLTF